MSRETAPRSKRDGDEASTTTERATSAPGSEERFTGTGALPPVSTGAAPAHGPTASELAFGPIRLDPNAPAKPVARLPLTDPKALEARAARLEAERLLSSKELDTSATAMRAVQLLLDLPTDERAKVIDGLDAKAFANLLDRVPEDQRERFASLVDASQDPKRKLALWAATHKARAKRPASLRRRFRRRQPKRCATNPARPLRAPPAWRRRRCSRGRRRGRAPSGEGQAGCADGRRRGRDAVT